jgi:aryl-alcohol dehydrogenase-like predicted oxidoreductase
MKYRRLGKSDIVVSEIGFGAWTIGLDWWGKKIEDQDAIKMLNKAYDLGITFYDTADIYGKGKSEKLIGETFKNTRNEVVYSSKWGYDIYDGGQVGHSEMPQKHNKTFLCYALEQSLSRLQTDYLDVYSLHNPKMAAIQDAPLFTSMDYLQSAGKFRSYGIALGPAIGWEEEGKLSMKNRNVTCLQTVYNILEQDPGNTFLRYGEKYDVGILARVPDASGVLTGKVNENTVFNKDDHRSTRKRAWIIEALQKVQNLKSITDTKGWSLTELAIKFILSQKHISVILPTMTSIEEIEMFANFSDGNYLTNSDLKYICDMYSNNFYANRSTSN